MSEEANNHIGKEELMSKFKELGIETNTVEHPEVFTVDGMMPYVQKLDGIVSKNLFLKDKKKKLYLLSTEHSRVVTLNDIAKQVGASGGLRLADESVLFEHLGVKQGCVTAYALINDIKCNVKFLCDADMLLPGKMVYFHPLSNAATTGMTAENFQRFLDHIQHKPLPVQFS